MAKRAAKIGKNLWLPAGLLLGLTIVAGRASTAQAPTASAPSQAVPPRSAESHLAQGYAALKNDRYDEAAREFRAALALDPHLVLRARFPLAVALFESHQPAAARQEFEAVRREVGDHPNVMYYLGRLDLMEGHNEAAIRELTRAESQRPFPDTAYYLGFAYLNQGELALAEKWLRKAAELVPDDPGVRYRLGILYRKQGREQEAKEAFALSEKLRRQQAEQSRLRLECMQKLNQTTLEEARPVCEQLDAPQDAQKLTMLGTIYGQHGDYREALEPLRRAAELAPQSPQMQYNLALCYFHLNQFEDARAPLARVAERWPDLFELNALYGVVLLRLGENLPAYRVLSHVHDLNPQDPETTHTLFQLALTLAEKSRAGKQYAAALKYLEEAAQLRPANPDPHRRMAEVYSLTGKADQAARERQKAKLLSSAGGGSPGP